MPEEVEEITNFKAQLPSATLEASESYPRGTLLTLSVQVRVKNVYTDEDRKGGLFIKHNLVIEEVNVTEVLTPAVRQALIASAAAAAEAAEASGTIHEEDHVDDVIQFAHGAEPVSDYEDEDRPVRDDELKYDYLPGEMPPGVVEDDTDPDAWMDEEEEGLHVDLTALVGA